MERTARMLRRTLLCAAFACPLAAFQPAWGLLVQCLCAPFLCAGAAPQRIWCKARSGFSHAAGRGLCAAGIAVGAGLALSRLLFPLMAGMPAWSAAALRMLLCLSSLLLQGTLLLRIQKADRLRCAAGLLSLLVGLLIYRL